jgi:5S rRNA maturation endonuclease (ribonuclease M5)
MISYEFKTFLNDTALLYLPTNKVKIGNKYNFRCPFCGDSHKSQSKKRGWWYLDNASFYCFNCSASMSGIEFIKNLAGIEYDTIKKEYLKLFLKSGISPNLSATFDIKENQNDIFNLRNTIKDDWRNPLSQDAITYLTNRKVLEAPYFNKKLYSCYTKDKSKEFILIPWTVNGIDAYYQLNDFHKYNPDIKYIFPRNKQKLIYGLDNIDLAFPYIIVFEGVYDSMFVKNGIAVGTKAITQTQIDLIKYRYPKHQIVISFDNDNAGISAMKKVVSSKHDFKFFNWFNSNTKEKDINDYILSKNNVNIFTNESLVEKLIVSKLTMKMQLVKNLNI